MSEEKGPTPLSYSPSPSTSESKEAPEPIAAPVNTEHLDRSVDELELSVRTANCLQNESIRFIGELVQRTEADLLRTKNFGRKCLVEVREILGGLGLQLGMELEGWEPPI
jgi:DNA-directed RNA polymerase subunit alpha